MYSYYNSSLPLYYIYGRCFILTQYQLTQLNLGQSLDDIANIDPRGYGVCKILYPAARAYTGESLCMNAAKKLYNTLKKGDLVYIMTGFVLRPYKRAETDGIVSAMLLCRALVKAFGVKPVVFCPEDNLLAVAEMAECLGLHLYDDIEDLKANTEGMGVIVFTKDVTMAEKQADEIIKAAVPSALISIECPGANKKGVYHNAVGLDVTDLEAKQDVLFDKLKALGVLNIAIGDLGNEMGMGAISSHLEQYIPYAAEGRCRCGCEGGLAARTATDNIITATVSDWGCYAMIAAIAFLAENLDVMHTPEIEETALRTACKNGMIDMMGDMIPAIDGFDLEMNKTIVSLMRQTVKSTLSLTTTCCTWFEKVNELGFFENESK